MTDCKALEAVGRNRRWDQRTMNQIAQKLRDQLGPKWSQASKKQVTKVAKALDY